MANLRMTVMLKTDIVDSPPRTVGKLYCRGQDDNRVITSGKVIKGLQEKKWKERFLELDPSRIVEPVHKNILQEHGAFEFLLGDEP